jgi:TPR repeat protein
MEHEKLLTGNVDYKFAEDSDDKDFLELLKKSESGDLDAQLKLGEIYKNGEDVAKNINKALYWYMTASLQNSADAMYEVGAIYDHEYEGIMSDYEIDYKVDYKTEAVNWYWKAKNLGHRAAASRVRRMLAPMDFPKDV